MYFTDITFVNFKNLQIENFSVGRGMYFIVGENGAGKTNFLDAVYYCGMTKSWFHHTDKEIFNYAQSYFRLKAVIQSDQSHELKVKVLSGLQKEISFDDKVYQKNADHIGRIPVIMIAPDDIFAFSQDSENRRRFLNHSLVQFDHRYLFHLLEYNKYLKQRNASLRAQKKNQKIDHTLLDIYDEKLIFHGVPIYEQRKELVKSILPLYIEFSRKISDGKQDSLLEYVSDLDRDFPQQLSQSREKDYFSLRTNVGVHKDQFEPVFQNYKLRVQGSQGQMKTALLALKLAQYRLLATRLHTTPVFLLDDIFSKLDRNRVMQLVQLIADEKIDQCFITDTDIERSREVSQSLSGKVFYTQMVDGKLNSL
ncbi:MAG: DNA replication and repair protein RecF [Saprospiraceae bacterium]|jgi:DNA replication and repair protein RecF|nr:DNA replication and repair protein RecF [Saprospiraceae bacterium]